MKVGRAIDARLQTAVSSGEEYSMISVQRLEDLMVPRFFWFDLPDEIISITVSEKGAETHHWQRPCTA